MASQVVSFQFSCLDLTSRRCLSLSSRCALYSRMARSRSRSSRMKLGVLQKRKGGREREAEEPVSATSSKLYTARFVGEVLLLTVRPQADPIHQIINSPVCTWGPTVTCEVQKITPPIFMYRMCCPRYQIEILSASSYLHIFVQEKRLNWWQINDYAYFSLVQ